MKEKKCWICGRTSKEVWEQGKGISVNWSEDENDCIIDMEISNDTLPVCCVCDIVMQQVICNSEEADRKYPFDGTYLVRENLKEELRELLKNL